MVKHRECVSLRPASSLHDCGCGSAASDADAPVLLEKLSDDEKLAWLIAKFGWNAVSSVGECIRSFPTSLTESPRSGLFAKFYQDISTYQHISSFVVGHCSTFFRCQPTLWLKFLHPQRGYALRSEGFSSRSICCERALRMTFFCERSVLTSILALIIQLGLLIV